VRKATSDAGAGGGCISDPASAPDAILLLETRPLARVPSAHVVPVIVSIDLVGEWLSLVEHLVRDQGVGGSNPLSPTIID
jgi:hypothetical protein